MFLLNLDSVREASCVRALNFWMRALYASNYWISSSSAQAERIHQAGRHFLLGYAKLAMLSWQLGEPRFALMPKVHMFWHLVDSMRFQRENFPFMENCMAMSCSMEEDFIGRFCFLTRVVSPRSRIQRSLERYLTFVLLMWMRSKRER